MVSASENTTFMSCSIISTASDGGRLRTRSIMRSVSAGDMPEVGSSSSSSSGSAAMAMATSS